MLIDRRKIETSSTEASGIEEQFKTNTVSEIKMDQRLFYYCGLSYPPKKDDVRQKILLAITAELLNILLKFADRHKRH